MTNEDYQKILHEIKNSITFVHSSLQLVEKMHPEVMDYFYWNDATQELNSLKKMLIELSSARLCTEIHTEPICLKDFLTDFLLSCAPFFAENNFRCEVSLAAPLPNISGDPARLHRALFNLLKNSYEAMNKTGTIHLSAHLQGSRVRLDLTDHGGGFAPEYLPKLFTPFETTKSDGTGLGLLITKQIIEAHGGQLVIDSRPQDGCTFSIFLPCD